MMLNTLFKITRKEVEKASLVLGKAFHDDPLWSEVIQDEASRRKKLPLIFEMFLRYALIYGEAYASSENLEGITIILPYNRADMTFWRLLRSGAWRLLRVGMKLGRGTGNRLGEISAPIIEAQKEILKRGYLYLQAIGVSPELQGQGFGGKLLRALFENADNEEDRVYLETSEENIQLYEKFRFQVVNEIRLPTIDLSMWGMVRIPRQTASA